MTKAKPIKRIVYSKELAYQICEHICDGKSLKAIGAIKGMPSRGCIFRWISEHAFFEDLYTRAKAEQIEIKVDEMNEIADNGMNDYMESQGKDGQPAGYRTNGEAIQRSKLRIDTIKWQASKLKPKKYGDRLQDDNKNMTIIINDKSKD